MNIKLLAVALSVMSVTACTPEKVLNGIVAADTGHNLIGYEPSEEDQPITTPTQSASSSSSSSSSSSEYVQPLGEPCEEGTFGFRLWTCVAGHRSYI